MRKDFANSTSTRWNADASEPTSSPSHPEPGYDYYRDQAVFDAGAVPSEFGS